MDSVTVQRSGWLALQSLPLTGHSLGGWLWEGLHIGPHLVFKIIFCHALSNVWSLVTPPVLDRPVPELLDQGSQLDHSPHAMSKAGQKGDARLSSPLGPLR